VSAAAVNFAQTARYFQCSQVTGVPVRPEIFEVPPRPVGNSALRLLVTAGAMGAGVQRDDAEDCGRLLEAVPGLTIVHQAGRAGWS
jgi:UDP-N-acetylglucosamine--N-acetylmuramyl-(pentapeptide) pyrophosphoryl-undecaprenol N-acetylglucosamine transferase